MTQNSQGERLSKVEGIVGEHTNRLNNLEAITMKLEENAQLITRLDERTLNIANSQEKQAVTAEKQSTKIDKLIFWMMTVGVGACVSVIIAAIILKN